VSKGSSISFNVSYLFIKSRRMIWVEHVALMGEITNVYEILFGKPEGKRPLSED
jgi:hypothetical protein